MITLGCTCIQPLYPTSIPDCLNIQECNVSHFECRQLVTKLLHRKGVGACQEQVSPLTSKITSSRFLNAHFHIHLDFIFSDVKDTSLCFQAFAVSFSLTVWCVRSRDGDPETPFFFTLNVTIVVFSEWFKRSVLGPRWWRWSRHRAVPHAALRVWNRVCSQRAGLPDECSKQTKPPSFPSVRLVVKECGSLESFPEVGRRRCFFLDDKRILEAKLGYFLSWTRRP